jgi:carboxyl-terminal processing protease
LQPITLNTLRQTFESAVKQYPDVIDENGMADACVQGMVDTLDKRTIYFTPQAFRDLVARGQGENAGLGIELGMRGNLAEVVWVIPDTPAERAQIRTGDRVLAIDGVSMENRPLDQIVLALRGKPDTTVRLTLARAGAKAPLQLEARRAAIRDPSVTAKRMRGAYLYVRIGSFQESMAALLAAALQQLSEASPPRGIVLDLRSSPGGILPATLGVAAAFLPRDRLIVSTKSQNKDQSMSFYARPEFYRRSREPDPFKDLPPTAKTVPLMVLVNRVTASGAEIVAGALQDYRRASVIGERSMGVGTIQTIRQIDRDIALKLTSAKTVRPSSGEIEGIGITPDIALAHDTYALPQFAVEDDIDIARALEELDKLQP